MANREYPFFCFDDRSSAGSGTLVRRPGIGQDVHTRFILFVEGKQGFPERVDLCGQNSICGNTVRRQRIYIKQTHGYRRKKDKV